MAPFAAADCFGHPCVAPGDGWSATASDPWLPSARSQNIRDAVRTPHPHDAYALLTGTPQGASAPLSPRSARAKPFGFTISALRAPSAFSDQLRSTDSNASPWSRGVPTAASGPPRRGEDTASPLITAAPYFFLTTEARRTRSRGQSTECATDCASLPLSLAHWPTEEPGPAHGAAVSPPRPQDNRDAVRTPRLHVWATETR